MADELVSPARRDEIVRMVDSWLEAQLAVNPSVMAVDREQGRLRWFVRMKGEEKDTFTLWLTLDQRTISFDTYVMPAPEENHSLFFENLLRRNRTFNGMAFSIGEEDAVFLGGRLPVGCLDEGELDRVLGETFVYVERCFRPAMRIGYASRFNG